MGAGLYQWHPAQRPEKLSVVSEIENRLANIGQSGVNVARPGIVKFMAAQAATGHLSGAHMLRYCLAAGLLAFCAIVGCEPLPPETPPPAQSHPFSQQEMVSRRESLRKLKPDARVGLVKSVLGSNSTAGIGDVDVKDFTKGDVISFIDSNDNTVSMGSVIGVEGNLLIVHYDVNAGGRAPLEGDLAIRMIK